jgi:ribosomal protein S18 acetylase RimI-like enzyme
MNLSTQSIQEYGVEATLEILTQGFSDYIVPIHLDVTRFYRMLRADSVDLAFSKVVLMNGECAGAGLVARRGWSNRLAGMAVIPIARRLGIGKWLLDHLMEAARDRGDQCIELEVIVGNDPAIQLYQNAGFQTIRKLLSFKLENPRGESSPFEKTDIRKIAQHVAANGLPRLPWQLSAETLAQSGPHSLGFQRDSAWVVISNPDYKDIQIQSLIVDPAFRRKGKASRLLRALFARFPNKTWHVPAICPGELGPFFESVGFIPQELSQLHMESRIG